MQRMLLTLCVLALPVQSACTPRPPVSAPTAVAADAHREVSELSSAKWRWMADRDVERLAGLFHEDARFVHMSGTWGTPEELEIIRSGSIHYKQADVHEVVVETFDDVAIVWNRITLLAHVRGSEVTNPFTVTEVYRRYDGGWKLLALTFSSVRPEHRIQP